MENTQKTITQPAPPIRKTTADTAPPTSSLPQHTPALSASAKAAEHRDYLGALATAIAHNRHYPRLSRRRGEEGRVVVGFHIAADGRLEAVRVLESSGRPRLDRAAVQTVQRTSPFRPPPSSLTPDEREIRLPVVFRLH